MDRLDDSTANIRQDPASFTSDHKPVPAGTAGNRLNRRAFFGCAAASSLLGLLGSAERADACEYGPLDAEARRLRARQIRMDMAQLQYERPVPDHVCNGDEERYPNRIGNYSKALPHNALGEVDPAAYNVFIAALTSGNPADFEAIPMGGPRKMTNPQAGLGFDLEGPDGHCMAQPPAPRLDSAEAAGEMVELYWMALLRDLPFTQYETSPLTLPAAEELSDLSDFRGPKQNGQVTPKTLFRGFTPGDLIGPYISQFLWKPIPYGALTIDQRMQTLLPKTDYMTDFASWLFVQNGGNPGTDRFDRLPRYIRTLRDLAQWVHVDALYEAYLNACLILLGMNAPLNPGNPYNQSGNQIGFGTFGGPHILSLVTEVATRALKAVWFQKWFVHRRLRPEEYGGRVDVYLTGRADYPLHPDVLNSSAVQNVYGKYGSYLLPMAFPEGSPTHPAYGAGHATVAGACVTILKAWFDERWPLPNPVIPTPDGLKLLAYHPPRAEPPLTVGGELNKVAANVGVGRNGAGVHWRSDYRESLLLGEEVAIGILQDQKTTYHEPSAFTFTRFDGTTITI